MAKRQAITWHDSIDSTNSEARRHISRLDNMSVIAARYQTAGRGQGDHKWHSRASENLMFSVVLKFGCEGGLAPLKASSTLIITEVITLAIREFLLAETGVECRIKWPNDIYVGDKKLCGILIENLLSGKNVSASIIGVGLNVNQTSFPEDLPNPVSMAVLTGCSYDIERTLSVLAEHIASMAEKTCTDAGRSFLEEEFNKYMFKLPGEMRQL